MTKDDIHIHWQGTLEKIKTLIGKKPKDLNAVLFLIGVQELGKGKVFYSKEDKEGLIHIAICTLLAKDDYYEFTHRDEDGWPHYKLRNWVDKKGIKDQVFLLKCKCVEYFEGYE